MKNNPIIITILVAVIFGGGGFFAGMKYQESKIPARFANFANGRAGSGQSAQRGQNQAGFRPVDGQVLSIDNNTITVKLQDGSSKIVLLTDSTNISKSSDATKDDLKTGDTIAAFGTQNSDGSLTAQNIQLNPTQRNFGNPAPTGN